MKWVRMKALGITVPLGKNKFYSDDGHVDDLKKHNEILIKKYKGNSIPTGDAFGQCYLAKENLNLYFNNRKIFSINLRNYVHIYYSKFQDDPTDIFIRSHEETHALEKLGKLKYLFLDMLKNSDIGSVIDSILFLIKNEEEELADFGAVYALRKRGLI